MSTNDSNSDAATKPLPAIIAKEVESLTKTIAAIMSLAPEAEAAAEAVEQFTNAFDGISCRASHLGDSVWIEVRTKSMAPVIALRRYLATKGYRLEAGGVQSHPDESRQVFCLGRLTLNVRFPGGEGSACRFVPVGTKTVPVYELRCDGSAEGGAL